jgi:hypothetical protein
MAEQLICRKKPGWGIFKVVTSGENMAEASAQQPQKVGRIEQGWRLTKSSWHVLKLDKELTALPLVSFFVTLGFIAILVVLGVIGASLFGSAADSSQDLPSWLAAVLVVLGYFFLTLIANFFGGAVIYGATQRFKGGNPTLSTSLDGAWSKISPLAGFSLMMATVGLILQLLEEKVPLAGQIAIWLVNASWSIANIFAVPVIVLSPENVSPLEATKRSVAIIKKVWGEGIVVNLGLGLIAMLTLFTYVVAWGAIAAVAGAISGGNGSAALTGLAIAGITLFTLGLVVIILIFSVLGGIAKAALYHYATTGEAPGEFDARLLAAAARPKRRIR